MTMTTVYLTYLVLCVGITIWVAHTLRKHGHIFLTDGLDDHKALTEALSHLLIVGFYLVNFGVICFALKSDQMAGDAQRVIELVSAKVGTILVVIGAMHFVLLAVFSSVRQGNEHRRNLEHRRHSLSGLAAKGTPLTEFVEPA
ncbi:MAG TPA: hypothetical protein VFG20_08310 [Planctomycetaceae bacterium]|nr:hypothetical protein [Planctomycetaceae bacterium]